MNDNNFLILGDESANEIPNFHDYAYVVNRIHKFIKDNVGYSLQMYDNEDGRDEIWDVLEEDIRNKSDEVDFLSHIYDCVETRVVYADHRKNNSNFIIKPNIDNSIFYYRNYRVALVKLTIFLNHDDMYYNFVFAKNDESLLNFYKYIFQRQREYLQNNVTIYTDKEDELQRKREYLSDMVNRDDVFMEDKTKTQIYRSIDEFFSKSGNFFKEFNVPYKRGILLYGKPGNGKTTLVKSIAGSISAPVVYWQITEHTSSYSVSQVFENVTNMAPAVLVIEV